MNTNAIPTSFKNAGGGSVPALITRARLRAERDPIFASTVVALAYATLLFVAKSQLWMKVGPMLPVTSGESARLVFAISSFVDGLGDLGLFATLWLWCSFAAGAWGRPATPRLLGSLTVAFAGPILWCLGTIVVCHLAPSPLPLLSSELTKPTIDTAIQTRLNSGWLRLIIQGHPYSYLFSAMLAALTLAKTSGIGLRRASIAVGSFVVAATILLVALGALVR
jgi:hypothetical protein